MTDIFKLAASLGPQADEYHRRELPGKDWVTCRGCSALRVFGWHYFYCRHLGDQSKPDEWNAGWRRIGDTTWTDVASTPCRLPVRDHLLQAEREGGGDGCPLAP